MTKHRIIKSDKIKSVGKDMLSSDRLVYTFLRSIVSSQAGSWVDLGFRMLFFAFVFSELDMFYRSNLSVAIGAIMGGVVNCTINFRFTFHASGQSVRAVVVKYIMVWTGSLLLNMYGTTFAAEGLSHWQWLINLGFRPDGIFAVATLTVSLLVSWFWNFLLQRKFVYRANSFDPVAIKIFNFLTFQKNKQ